MKKDARKLPQEIQEEKRRTAISLWKKSVPTSEISEVLEVSIRSVQLWIVKYKQCGLKGLKGKPRGNKEGTGRTLTEDQESHVKRLITDKYPEQLKLDYVLWTRKAVMELIEKEYGISMPIRTVGEYLKRWGMTPQKPQKRAYEQRAPEVKQWLEEDYPAIKKQAKKENAEIFWGDETGLKNNCQHERGYAPRGKTPIVKLNANNESINMLSAVTNQGKVRFRLFDGTMNADILIDFMMRLVNQSNRKVFLILDNLKVHHAKPVKEWVEKHKAMIEVFYLPAYSPELNPDEYLNCDLKKGVHSGKPARNKKQLKEKTRKHMKMLQRKPSRVKKYFMNENIKYAS